MTKVIPSIIYHSILLSVGMKESRSVKYRVRENARAYISSIYFFNIKNLMAKILLLQWKVSSLFLIQAQLWGDMNENQTNSESSSKFTVFIFHPWLKIFSLTGSVQTYCKSLKIFIELCLIMFKKCQNKRGVCTHKPYAVWKSLIPLTQH